MRFINSVKVLPYTYHFIIFIIMTLALIIRVHGLGDASLWLDEVLTISLSSLPMPTLWVTPYDPTPPLFYTVEKLVLLFGDSEFLIRLPSVIFNVLTIYVMYRAAYLTVGKKGALATAIFLALSTSNIEYAQEARAYSLLELMISIAFFGLLQLSIFFDKKDSKVTFNDFMVHGGLIYGTGSIAALYTHNSAVFFIFGVQIYFFSLFFVKKEKFLELIKFWFFINIIIFILWVPWLSASIEVGKSGVFSWLKQCNLMHALYTIGSVHGLNFIYMWQPFINIMVVIIILAGLYFLKENIDILVLCFSLLLSSSIIIWLFGYIKPVFMFRTIVWGTIISAFLIGVIFSKIRGIFFIVSLTLMTIIGIKGLINYYEYNASENENWRDSVEFIKGNAKNNEPIIICASYVMSAFSYYANEKIINNNPIFGWSKEKQGLMLYDIKTNDGYHPNINFEDRDGKIWKNSSFDFLQGKRLWVIQSHCNEGDITNLFNEINERGFNEISKNKFKGISMYIFVKK